MENKRPIKWRKCSKALDAHFKRFFGEENMKKMSIHLKTCQNEKIEMSIEVYGDVDEENMIMQMKKCWNALPYSSPLQGDCAMYIKSNKGVKQL